jgi:2'-5' RNA ligase
MTELTTDSAQPMRLFYALWPDDATRAALMRWQETVHGRKTRSQNLHLTLAFLGQQPATSLFTLQEILMQLPQAQMTLILDRIGYFSRQKIAWAGIQAVPDALIGLYQTLMQELARHNIAFDQSAFKPHITLARDAASPSGNAVDPIRWQADQVALVQSAAQPEGGSYRILASRKLSP